MRIINGRVKVLLRSIDGGGPIRTPPSGVCAIIEQAKETFTMIYEDSEEHVQSLVRMEIYKVTNNKYPIRILFAHLSRLPRRQREFLYSYSCSSVHYCLLGRLACPQFGGTLSIAWIVRVKWSKNVRWTGFIEVFQ